MNVVVRVLGPVGATVDGVSASLGGPRQRLVVARLAASFGRAVPTPALAWDVWRNGSATDAVKTTVSRLRKTLGAEAIVRDAHGYAFDPAKVALDARQFSDRIGHARSLDVAREQIEVFTSALALWDGPAYSGVDAEFCRVEAARLDEERLEVVADHLVARFEVGEAHTIVPELQSLVAEHPYREVFTELLMRALYQCGRQRDALAMYQDLATTLRDDLGLVPNPVIRSLEVSILQQAPELDDFVGASSAACAPTARVFVGRESEFGRLERALDTVAERQRASVLVIAGQPGIGKTALLDAFAGSVRRNGGTVLRSACPPTERVPFDAMVQSIEPLVVGLGRRVLEPDLIALAALMPGVGALPSIAADLGVDRDVRRLRIHRAMQRVFDLSFDDRPMVLAIDDLHWIDAVSLEILDGIVSSNAARRLLVVVTCRTNELLADGPIASFLAGAATRLAVSTVELDRLDEAATRAIVAKLALDDVGVDVDALASSVVEHARGHPLFVREMVAHSLERADGGGPRGPIPATPGETISERLGLLSRPTLEVLNAAAVFGRAATLDDLRAVTGGSLASAKRAATAAVRRGLLRLDGPVCYVVSHWLVHHALLDRLTPGERSRLHATAAAFLVSQHGSSIEVAEHLCEGIPTVQPLAAAQGAVRAGDECLDRGATALAASLYQRAVDVLQSSADDPSSRGSAMRAAAHIGLGHAMTGGVDAGPPRDHFDRAMAFAAECGEAELFAKALLGRTQFGVSHEHRDEEMERVAQAIEMLGPEATPMKVRLLLWGAWQLLYGADHRDAEPYVTEAKELAERIDDPASIAATRQCEHALLVAAVAPLSDRDLLREQIVEDASAAARWDGSLINGASVFDDLLEHGDLGVFRRELERYRLHADALGRPYERWSARAMRFVVAMWPGHLDEAEAAMTEADSIGRSLGVEVSRGAAAAHLLLVSWERDQLSQAVGLVEHTVATAPSPSLWTPVLALAYLEAGRIDDAREVSVKIPGSMLAMAHNQNRVNMASIAAEVVDAVRSADLTSEVERQLRPFAGRLRVSPTATFTLGPYDRMLGLCALARDDLDLAVERFAAARQLSKKCELVIWEARAAAWEAETLVRRDGKGDCDRAERLLVDTSATATSIRSKLLERMIAGTRSRLA